MIHRPMIDKMMATVGLSASDVVRKPRGPIANATWCFCRAAEANGFTRQATADMLGLASHSNVSDLLSHDRSREPGFGGRTLGQVADQMAEIMRREMKGQ